jgi:hypothetical protein
LAPLPEPQKDDKNTATTFEELKAISEAELSRLIVLLEQCKEKYQIRAERYWTDIFLVIIYFAFAF